MKHEWRRNIWTDSGILDVTDNGRIKRQFKPYLYQAEYWGDYSLKYPIRGYWTPSLVEAKKQLALMAEGKDPCRS